MADETTTPEAVEAPAEAAPEAAPAEAKPEATHAKEESKVEINPKFKDIVAAVEKFTVLELHELVKTLEGHWGVSAAAVAVAGPGAGAGDDSAANS